MPNNEEHAQHSQRRYGVSAEDLHRWMDEPSFMYRGQHRRFRHNPDHPPQWAVEKYGFETAQNVMLDHIYLDRVESKRTAIDIELIHIVDATTPEGEKVGIVIPEFEGFEKLNRRLLATKAKIGESKFSELMLAKARKHGWRIEIPDRDGGYCGIPYRGPPTDWTGLRFGLVWLGWISLIPYVAGEVLIESWWAVWIMITVAFMVDLVRHVEW